MSDLCYVQFIYVSLIMLGLNALGMGIVDHVGIEWIRGSEHRCGREEMGPNLANPGAKFSKSICRCSN